MIIIQLTFMVFSAVTRKVEYSFKIKHIVIKHFISIQISDDDRMSLTTAVSDEEDPGESAMNSPYKGKQTGAAAASFNCTGAVRKAG